jgi:hypothetical protein
MESSIDERFDHSLHHRRSDSIAEHFDAIATAAVNEPVRRGKAHCAPELIHLQHPKHWFMAIPRDETEPIKSGERAQRSVQTLPSPAPSDP